MLAPIRFRKSARATTSGSRAPFSIMVVPRARTAAIITFSVAVTLGYSKLISAPRRPRGAAASIKP
jgi:hypothetical protein